MWRHIKWTALTFLTTVAFGAVAISLYILFAPQFGGQPKGKHLVTISTTQHYQNGQFVNLVETVLEHGYANTAKTIRDFLTVENISPTGPIPVKFAQSTQLLADTLTTVTGRPGRRNPHLKRTLPGH